MSILAYASLPVGAYAVYTAYSSAKEPTKGGLLSISKYKKSYGLSFLSLILGLVLGLFSIISGGIASGFGGIIIGLLSLILVGVIATLDLGSKAAEESKEAVKKGAEFAKENPEAAAQIAEASAKTVEAAGSAVEQTAGAAEQALSNDDTSDQTESSEADHQSVTDRIDQLNQKALDSNWKYSANQVPLSMKCPKCGIPWTIISNASLSLNNLHKRLDKNFPIYSDVAMYDGNEIIIGVNVLGTDELLGKTDVQCVHCNHQDTVRIN